MKHPKLDDDQFPVEFARLAETAGDGQDCPPPETIWRSGRGELDPPENEPVVVHLADCTACATAWRIAREMASGSSVAGLADRPRRRPARTWLPLLAAAAVVVVAVGLGVQFLGPSPEEPAVIRTQESDWLESTLDESVALSREEVVLAWTAGPEDTTYDVLVSDEEGTILTRANDLSDPRFVMPAGVLEGVEGGRRILWQVTARLPDGRVRQSETFIAQIE